jgi:carboxyl-terminal processing protease
MIANKKDDLMRFKPEITQFIEEEIAARSMFQRGRVEASLKNDVEVNEAKKILLDVAKVKSILTTIDKPTKPFNANKKF